MRMNCDMKLRQQIESNASLGFTLLELIITILMASILLGVAAPSIWSVIESNRAAAASNELITSLNAARGNAVSRRRNVSLCTSGNGATCRAAADTNYTNWHAGWLSKLDATGEILDVNEGLNSTYQMSSTSNTIVFDPSGAITALAQVTFNLTIPSCSGDKQRNIFVSTTGRISVRRVNCP